MENKLWDLEKFKGNIALLNEEGNKLTYRGLNEEAQKISNVFDKRCLVFSLCTNSIGSVIGYTAFVNTGKAVPVQLSNHLDQELLGKLLETYQPAYIWLPKEGQEKSQEKIEKKITVIIAIISKISTVFMKHTVMLC